MEENQKGEIIQMEDKQKNDYAQMEYNKDKKTGLFIAGCVFFGLFAVVSSFLFVSLIILGMTMNTVESIGPIIFLLVGLSVEVLPFILSLAFLGLSFKSISKKISLASKIMFGITVVAAVLLVAFFVILIGAVNG